LFDWSRFFVPTMIGQRAARSRGQGWPSLCWSHKACRCQAMPWRRRARRDAGWSDDCSWWAARLDPGLGREWRMRHHRI